MKRRSLLTIDDMSLEEKITFVRLMDHWDSLGNPEGALLAEIRIIENKYYINMLRYLEIESEVRTHLNEKEFWEELES